MFSTKCQRYSEIVEKLHVLIKKWKSKKKVQLQQTYHSLPVIYFMCTLKSSIIYKAGKHISSHYSNTKSAITLTLLWLKRQIFLTAVQWYCLVTTTSLPKIDTNHFSILISMTKISSQQLARKLSLYYSYNMTYLSMQVIKVGNHNQVLSFCMRFYWIIKSTTYLLSPKNYQGHYKMTNHQQLS